MDKKGFTLIELLVVIVILSILATFVGIRIMSKPEEARRTQAQIQIQALENALKMYMLDNGEYPSTEQAQGPGREARRRHPAQELEGRRLPGQERCAQRSVEKRICLPVSRGEEPERL